MKQEPDIEIYNVRVETLSVLEKQAENQEIDIFYGDTSTGSVTVKVEFLNKVIAHMAGNSKMRK